MAKYAMLIDLVKCVGCEACTVSCQMEYGLDAEHRFTRVHRYEFGTYPRVGGAVVTTQCMHCDDPPCVRVCPSGASAKLDSGFVVVDEEKCIGCQYCLNACPYDARVFDETRKVAQKCSFCYERVQQGQSPACVQTCMALARLFGDTENPDSEIARALARRTAHRVPGTSILYVAPKNLQPDYLPAAASIPGYVSTWKNFVQPAGKSLMGAVTGAVILSFLMNLGRRPAGHAETDNRGDSNERS